MPKSFLIFTISSLFPEDFIFWQGYLISFGILMGSAQRRGGIHASYPASTDSILSTPKFLGVYSRKFY